jgi:hypothetical protein
MTITIIRRNQIIVINRVHIKGITPVVEACLYDLIPFYYRSAKAKVEVDRILGFVGKDFVSFVREVRI